MRTSLLALACALPLAAAPAAAQELAARPAPALKPQTLRLAYDAYVGGLHAAALEVEIDIDADRYRMQGGMRTMGFLDYMAGWRYETRSAGRQDGGRLLPGEHVAESVSRGRERRTSLRWQGGRVTASITPPPDDDREPVPEKMKAEAFDPLTGALDMIRLLAGSGTCNGAVPMFDGRRRFDLRFTDLGPSTVKASRYSTFSGPARACRAELQRIAGYDKKGGQPGSGNREDRPAEVWVAPPRPGALPVPVRIETTTRWGEVVVHLTKAE
ncbi:MAG TPA: DUF3108 domain-containing protein [Alphaproteobacteria bacterium]|nr:DUF3108 domain-containing protein [Alphaproteobacteria bacterium]